VAPWLAALRGPPAGSSLARGQSTKRGSFLGASLSGGVSEGGLRRPVTKVGAVKKLRLAINNRLRTGTDKGNPTV